MDIHSPKKLFEEIGKNTPPVYLEKVSEESKQMAQELLEMAGKGKYTQNEHGDNKKDIHREFRRQSNEDIKQLSLAWMDLMVNDSAQLREKMSLFWHGHFACRDANIFFTQQLLHP